MIGLFCSPIGFTAYYAEKNRIHFSFKGPPKPKILNITKVQNLDRFTVSAS
jgi:hypothetical protein